MLLRDCPRAVSPGVQGLTLVTPLWLGMGAKEYEGLPTEARYCRVVEGLLCAALQKGGGCARLDGSVDRRCLRPYCTAGSLQSRWGLRS